MKYNYRFFYLIVLLIITRVSSNGWHLSFPTIGLQQTEPPSYPFLPHYFSLSQLAPTLGKKSKIALIDNEIKGLGLQDASTMAYHGNYMASLIGGSREKSSCSLSSRATLLLITAFDEYGKSSKKKLIEALKSAHNKQSNIVCMGLKLDGLINASDSLTRTFEQLLNSFNYIVAASGNSANQEAYPACSLSVPFDVGAFAFDGSSAPIANFSGFAKDAGPLFVMPGVDIIGIGIDNKLIKRSGTSVAAALMTAVVALIVSEFSNDFNREQILTACYCSALKMHNTQDWQDKVILGAPDARLALFMLQVIRHMRNQQLITNSHFEIKNFLSLCQTIRNELLTPVNEYASQFPRPINFEKEFIDYWQATNSLNEKSKSELCNQFAHFSLDEAIIWTANRVQKLLQKSNDPSNTFLPNVALEKLYFKNN